MDQNEKNKIYNSLEQLQHFLNYIKFIIKFSKLCEGSVSSMVSYLEKKVDSKDYDLGFFPLLTKSLELSSLLNNSLKLSINPSSDNSFVDLEKMIKKKCRKDTNRLIDAGDARVNKKMLKELEL
jgi:hypothetical protein